MSPLYSYYIIHPSPCNFYIDMSLHLQLIERPETHFVGDVGLHKDRKVTLASFGVISVTNQIGTKCSSLSVPMPACLSGAVLVNNHVMMCGSRREIMCLRKSFSTEWHETRKGLLAWNWKLRWDYLANTWQERPLSLTIIHFFIFYCW